MITFVVVVVVAEVFVWNCNCCDGIYVFLTSVLAGDLPCNNSGMAAATLHFEYVLDANHLDIKLY